MAKHQPHPEDHHSSRHHRHIRHEVHAPAVPERPHYASRRLHNRHNWHTPEASSPGIFEKILHGAAQLAGAEVKTVGIENTIKAAREAAKFRLAVELANPDVMRAFADRVRTETGNEGREGQIAFAETILNRAAKRGKSLMSTLSGNYYPKGQHTPGRSDDPAYHDVVRTAFEQNTNYSRGATGNATGSVRFGGGPVTAKIGNEVFGVEIADMPRSHSTHLGKHHQRHQFAVRGAHGPSA